ncbi:MAG: ATPase [Planctomycetaceae bacterium]|nr:ATPase [Planctomycetaceae bacterium]
MSSATPPTSADVQQRLIAQYAEIAQLAGALAHEIKNPLSTIRLNMELLAEDLDEAQTPAQRRALKRIDTVQRECSRLQDLLDNFLDFAKVRRLSLKPTDLNRELQETLDFFAPEAAEGGIEVVRYFDPDLPTVQLDREVFRGSLLNLLINAKQAMPGGGQIVLRTRTAGDRAVLQIIDTGCGIDDHTAAHMFEAFYSTKPGGSGLGLPTAAKIIEAHGGMIQVQSELGQGTQFTIELPVAPRLGRE